MQFDDRRPFATHACQWHTAHEGYCGEPPAVFVHDHHTYRTEPYVLTEVTAMCEHHGSLMVALPAMIPGKSVTMTSAHHGPCS